MKKDFQHTTDKGAIDAEAIIVGWAKAGLLAEAGRNAVSRSLAKGLSVTLAENGVVFRLHPDGSRTTLRTIPIVPAEKYAQRTFKIKL